MALIMKTNGKNWHPIPTSSWFPLSLLPNPNLFTIFLSQSSGFNHSIIFLVVSTSVVRWHGSLPSSSSSSSFFIAVILFRFVRFSAKMPGSRCVCIMPLMSFPQNSWIHMKFFSAHQHSSRSGKTYH